MRIAIIMFLCGLIIVGYSFIGDAHLNLYWTDVVQKPNADVQYDKIYFSFHRDWIAIRWIGGVTSALGILGLIARRKKC